MEDRWESREERKKALGVQLYQVYQDNLVHCRASWSLSSTEKQKKRPMKILRKMSLQRFCSL